MHPNFYLHPIAVCLALTMASSAIAAELVPLQKASFKSLQQQFHLSLPGDVRPAVLFPNTLQFIQQRTDHNHFTHIRMQQHYKGFVVYGGYAIMHSMSTAKNLLTTQEDVQINGGVYRGLESELGQPPTDFVKNADFALQQFKAQFQGKELSEEQVTSIIFIDDKHQAYWAYKVSLYIRHDDKIPERPAAIIDAKSYKPFVQWNDIKTASRTAVKGIGYGGNSKTGAYIFGETYPLLNLSRDNKNGICYMENTDVRVINMAHEYFALNRPMKFACKKDKNTGLYTFWTGYKGDGYDKENGAFSPTNDALYSGYVIKHMYHDWYNVEVLAKRGVPLQLVMRVHYGQGYGNAYWDSKQMTFGDGDTTLYPLVSLGISAHEISHGFTEQHADLAYHGRSGGINESFSDMAAQAAEFYSTGANTWEIGAEIVKEGNGLDALRYMDKPSRDGMSIDSADQYFRGMDVHYSSGVFNRLFYLMAKTSGWDPRKAFKVMVKANMDYWTPITTYDEAGCGVINATHDLGFSVDDVKKALTEVAINYEACAVQGT